MDRRVVACRPLLLAAALAAAVAGCRSTSGGGQTGSLAGTVHDGDTAAPISGAVVTVGAATTRTDDLGKFVLQELDVGDRPLTVDAPGYRSLSQTIAITAGGNTVELELRRGATTDGGAADGAGGDGPRPEDAGPQDGPCASDALRCNGQCTPCPAGATATACAGSQCVATACATGYRSCDASCCAWVIEPVGTISYQASEATLALDASGQPHVAFADWANSQVRYATRGAGGFNVETVAWLQASDLGLVVDSYGVPHLAYTRSSDSALTYATRSGTWTETPLYTRGFHNALAIDAANGLHIAFMASSDTKAWLSRAYRSGSGGSWRFDPVDDRGTTGATGYNTAVAVTPAGQAHILYWVSVSGNSLWYAPEASGYFSPQWIENLDFIMGADASITLDSAANPVVAYPAYLGGQTTVLRAGRRSGGSWSIGQVDSTTTVYAASTALDPAQTQHVAFSRYAASFEIAYATATSGGWRVEVVGPGELWHSRALAFDSAGNPHLVFVSPYNDTTRYVWYAH